MIDTFAVKKKNEIYFSQKKNLHVVLFTSDKNPQYSSNAFYSWITMFPIHIVI